MCACLCVWMYRLNACAGVHGCVYGCVCVSACMCVLRSACVYVGVLDVSRDYVDACAHIRMVCIGVCEDNFMLIHFGFSFFLFLFSDVPLFYLLGYALHDGVFRVTRLRLHCSTGSGISQVDVALCRGFATL